MIDAPSYDYDDDKGKGRGGGEPNLVLTDETSEQVLDYVNSLM